MNSRETWLNSNTAELVKKPKWEGCTLTAAVINAQREELEKITNVIVNTPKPKPVIAEPPLGTIKAIVGAPF